MTDTKSTMFYSLEKSMYDAFSIGDSSKFAELVRPNALRPVQGFFFMALHRWYVEDCF